MTFKTVTGDKASLSVSGIKEDLTAKVIAAVFYAKFFGFSMKYSTLKTLIM